MDFQKLQNLWVAKAIMSSYILCKIFTLCARLSPQKIFNISGSNSLEQLTVLSAFNVQFSTTRNCIAYANLANIVNKDSFIAYPILKQPWKLADVITFLYTWQEHTIWTLLCSRSSCLLLGWTSHHGTDHWCSELPMYSRRNPQYLSQWEILTKRQIKECIAFQTLFKLNHWKCFSEL